MNLDSKTVERVAAVRVNRIDSADSSDDIFYINNKSIDQMATARADEPTETHLPATCPADSQGRHCNLDAQPLTCSERLRLARIHYLTIANCIRLVIVAISLGFFGYNAQNILSQYTQFDTLVIMKFSEPVSTTLPAISICSHCVLCAIKNETLTRTQVEELLRSQQIWRKSTYNQSDLEHFSHSKLVDATIGCWIRRNSSNPGDIIECQHIARPIVSIIYGHKCWTFFADYFGHIRRKLKYNPEQAFLHYDQSPDIIFSVNGRFLSASPIVDYTLDGENGSMLGNGQGFWTNFVDLNGRAHTGLYISIHEPLTLPDLYYLAFYRLKLGTSLYLPFIKRQQTLCPGYNPQCYTYRDDSASPDDIDVNTITEEGKALTSSGLGAYRSRSECYIFCMWRLLNTNRCANFYSSYTSELMDREMLYRFREKVQAHAKQFANWSLDTLQQVFGQDYGMKFCGKSNEGYREYMKAKKICMETCPVSCVVESYTDDVDYVESPLESANGTRIVIKWAAKPVVEVVHRPKLWLSEFLGTLGGTLHIWLKISVIYSIIHVVHFIQSCELLPKASCFRWWFAQKKLELNKEDS